MTDWRAEYASICEVIDHTEEAGIRRDRLKKQVKKTLRKLERAGQPLNYDVFPPSFRWNLCAARMRMGVFDNYDGWEFRSDWSMTFQGYNGFSVPIPKWMGGPVDKLVLLGEQGIGDELLFATAIPELILRYGRDMIQFQCMPRLRDFFERSYGIECVDRRGLSQLTEGHAVALADLFMFYRRDKSHFPRRPYAKLKQERVDYWRSRLPRGENIGIAWKARHGDLDPREMMFEDANYINLQYLSHPDGKWDEPLPEGVIDLGCNPLEDIDDHMHLIAALDKVVTITQTVVHECGAVGTECHAIRPTRGTGEVNNSLWYYGTGNTQNWVWGSKVYDAIKDYEDSHSRSR